MSIKGGAYSNFQRALDTGNLLLIRAAAAELPTVNLDDALRICVLVAEQEPERFERAAVRWHGRWEVEAPADLRLRESELMLVSLGALSSPARQTAFRTLVELGRWSGLSTIESSLRPWL